jgi:hypothetical protein
MVPLVPQRPSLPAISARGNWDERIAQIDRIREREDRVHPTGGPSSAATQPTIMAMQSSAIGGSETRERR